MKIMQTVVRMHRMRFFARHGVLPQETVVGASFVVDLRLTLRGVDEALAADRLAATVNYADVYECLKAEMAVPSQLLEHAAARMARVLLERFPRIAALRIRLTKEVPPIEGFDGAGVSVELDAAADDAGLTEGED